MMLISENTKLGTLICAIFLGVVVHVQTKHADVADVPTLEVVSVQVETLPDHDI